MTETRMEYAVPGQHSGPGEHSLLPYDSPLYLPPQWRDVRAVMQQIGLTGSQVANLVGVQPRTVRKWVSPPDTANHNPIPYAAWRLLLIAARLAEPTIL